MTEENIPHTEEDPATEEASEGIAELAREIEPQAGNAPDEATAKLRPVCSLADQNYNQILALIKEMKGAESVLHKYHNQDGSVSPEDLEAAKEKFNQVKKSYLQMGNQINEGIKQVYIHAKTHPEDLLAQNLYKTYLAILLASLETRNPVQRFVERIAQEGFEMERPDLAMFEEDADAGRVAEAREKKLLEETERLVIMLEVRYQKRLAANRLRQGERPAKAISRLTGLSRRDPTDINTYIWLANLLSGELKRQRDHNKRIGIRDDILDYCKKAFAAIDDYLNLQGIENLNERDRMRAEYVKTITSIRKPLMEQGG